MGKVHGSLARAGKVKGQTPKVETAPKEKSLTGRAKKRQLFNKRYSNLKAGANPLKQKLNSIASQVERKQFKEDQIARIASKKESQ